MEICSNICSLRDAPLSRPYSVSAYMALEKWDFFNNKTAKSRGQKLLKPFEKNSPLQFGFWPLCNRCIKRLSQRVTELLPKKWQKTYLDEVALDILIPGLEAKASTASLLHIFFTVATAPMTPICFREEFLLVAVICLRITMCRSSRRPWPLAGEK